MCLLLCARFIYPLLQQYARSQQQTRALLTQLQKQQQVLLKYIKESATEHQKYAEDTTVRVKKWIAWLKSSRSLHFYLKRTIITAIRSWQTSSKNPWAYTASRQNLSDKYYQYQTRDPKSRSCHIARNRRLVTALRTSVSNTSDAITRQVATWSNSNPDNSRYSWKPTRSTYRWTWKWCFHSLACLPHIWPGDPGNHLVFWS